MTKKKNPAAMALGKKGGTQRAKNLTAEELSAQGRKAILTRWKNHKKKKETNG